MVRNLHAVGEHEQALGAADALLAEVAEQGGWGDNFEAPYHLYCALAPLGDVRADRRLGHVVQPGHGPRR